MSFSSLLEGGFLQGAFFVFSQDFFILRAQHFLAPPGLLLHPFPPHFPHFLAQQTLPSPLDVIPFNAAQPRF